MRAREAHNGGPTEYDAILGALELVVGSRGGVVRALSRSVDRIVLWIGAVESGDLHMILPTIVVLSV